MLIFCALTQFLLLTIIICLLSNSLEKVGFPHSSKRPGIQQRANGIRLHR